MIEYAIDYVDWKCRKW